MILIILLGLFLLNAVKTVLHSVTLFDPFLKLLNLFNLFSCQFLCYLRDALKAGRLDFDTPEFQFLLDDPQEPKGDVVVVEKQ